MAVVLPRRAHDRARVGGVRAHGPPRAQDPEREGVDRVTFHLVEPDEKEGDGLYSLPRPSALQAGFGAKTCIWGIGTGNVIFVPTGNVTQGTKSSRNKKPVVTPYG